MQLSLVDRQGHFGYGWFYLLKKNTVFCSQVEILVRPDFFPPTRTATSSAYQAGIAVQCATCWLEENFETTGF